MNFTAICTHGLQSRISLAIASCHCTGSSCMDSIWITSTILQNLAIFNAHVHLSSVPNSIGFLSSVMGLNYLHTSCQQPLTYWPLVLFIEIIGPLGLFKHVWPLSLANHCPIQLLISLFLTVRPKLTLRLSCRF